MQARNNQLKLIAVNILPNCRSYIRKNLEINSPYLLYNDYLLSSDKSGRKIISYNNDMRHISSSFFTLDSDINPIVSINAIVGKNGSGKSAIVDIILRLINNLSYKVLSKYNTYNGAELRWIVGLNAQLYFSLGGDFYLLEQDGDDQKNCSLFKFESKWVKQTDIKKTLGESFFYTILMNYSLHAFNTWDYKEEWEKPDDEKTCWINGISHKNDGYQTPLVINPMRTEGSINIKRENSLAKDRLISLFFNEKNERNLNFTDINDKSVVYSLVISLASEKVERKYKQIIDDWKNKDIELRDDSFFENLKNDIINFWKGLYTFNPLYDNDIEYNAAILYLVYKTISIAQKYDVFDNSSSLSPNCNDTWDSTRKETINKLIIEINKENSHITFKLRQILAFLVFRHIKISGNETEIEIDDFAKLTEGKISKKWSYLDFVPAPCFNVEIRLMNKENTGKYSFSKLSSGERQLIYTASGILYHIRNINSISPNNNRRIKYKHISIILDEIELYFHPEYQQIFVEYILNSINSLGFLDIKSINILMITHSPFILSDIPKNNVLFLNKGKANREMQEDTFGANIHTLLKNGFFLDSVPIGSFSKLKINEMFKKLHLGSINEDLYNEILLVSEPFIRSQLLKKYNELISSEKCIALEAEIRKLHIEIDEIKKIFNK